MKICEIKTKISSLERPPFFMGVVLKKDFGKALKSVSCINHFYKCDGCFVARDCLYHKLYESQNEYKKFRFDFNLGEQNYDFNLFLFDDICDELPYIASALDIMITKNGIGKKRIKDANFRLFVNDQECRKDGLIALPDNYIKSINHRPKKQNIKIDFITPLRIKKSDINIQDILNSIIKRQNGLFNASSKYPNNRNLKCENNLKFIWVSDNSQNSDQNKAMKLGGLVGNMRIYGLDEEDFELLELGEIIGVGKQCVYGLGKIKLEYENEQI